MSVPMIVEPIVVPVPRTIIVAIEIQHVTVAVRVAKDGARNRIIVSFRTQKMR